MEEKIKLVQKNSRQYRWILRIVLILVGIWILYSVGVGVYEILQKPEVFEVKEIVDKFDVKKTVLMINGKEQYDVVMNQGAYQINKETGLPNLKASALIDTIVVITKAIFIVLILFIVYKMNEEIAKEISPFTIKNVKRLKAISLLILGFTFIPMYIQLTITFLVFLVADAYGSSMGLLMIFISFAIWGISYILEYACALQSEVDEMI